MKKICATCGARFDAPRKHSRCCSKTCYRVERSRVESESRKSLWIDRPCARCQAIFRDHPNARYCGPVCKGLSHVEREKARDRRRHPEGA